MKSESKETIAKELQKFVEENITDKAVAVEVKIPFHELGVDSISIIQIVLFIERKFNVSMTESDLTQENLKSIYTLSEFIFNKN